MFSKIISALLLVLALATLTPAAEPDKSSPQSAPTVGGTSPAQVAPAIAPVKGVTTALPPPLAD